MQFEKQINLSEIKERLEEQELEKLLWVAMKFGIPFFIIFILFIAKGIVANYLDRLDNYSEFYVKLLGEFMAFANHTLIIVIIALFEIISGNLLKSNEKVDGDGKTNIIMNIFLILLTSFMLIFSELQMDDPKIDNPNWIFLLHYFLQLLLTLAIFVKIFYTDLKLKISLNQ